MRNVVHILGVISVICLFSLALGEPPSVCTRCMKSNSCKPPDCFCCREDLQLPIPLENIPQIVFFTFDDALTDQVAGFYRTLFDTSRKNPNGCPVSMTLFISHDNTKYRLVQEFYEKGMEIASHSVTHSTMNNTNFLEEAKSQKENLAKLAKVPIGEITGWRSPFLKPTGDLQPDSLKKLGYSYDATLTFSKRSFREKPPGPFTLDFGFPYECQVKPCPRSKHPGFWEVPVVSLMDYQHKYDCVYVDGCMNAPPDEDAAFQFLWDNFNSYYTQTRMPFGINMHPSWFYYPDRLKAMDRFIQKLVSMNDVYIVSASRMLEWLKHPTPLQDIRSFTPWACDGSEKRLRAGSTTGKADTRTRPTHMTSWASREAGSPRRFFAPRVMYPAYTPPATDSRQPVFTGTRDSLRPGILTLTAKELDGRAPLYPGNLQLNDRLRQRQQDQDQGWQGRIGPSMGPRIATISIDRLRHIDVANNRVENLPNVDLPVPSPSVASHREMMSRREQFIRQQNLVERERQDAVENVRQRRIERLQRQRHRDLLAQQRREELAQQQDILRRQKQAEEQLQQRQATAVPTLASKRRNLENKLQKTIVWKPAILDTQTEMVADVPSVNIVKKTTPRVFQKTVKVFPLFTRAPVSQRSIAPKPSERMLPKLVTSAPLKNTNILSSKKPSVDELTNFIQKIESQTNKGNVKVGPIPTQVPRNTPSSGPVWVQTRVTSVTEKPRYTPTARVSRGRGFTAARRQDFTAVTPTPFVFESPMERQRRLQVLHLRRTNETIFRQREREERIRRQQIQELRDKQMIARQNMMQSDFNNRRFEPNLPLLSRERAPLQRPVMHPRMVDRQGFSNDVLHPSVAQRLAWNRFLRQMFRAP